MKRIWTALLASTLLFSAQSAFATPVDFDFEGDFVKDNDVLTFNFSLTEERTITIFSSSWLCGGCGEGFDPILAIWSAAGNLMNQQDDGGNTGSTMSNGVSYNHGTWDSYFTLTLGAGNYFASVTQYDNFANGSTFAEGFRYDGNPTFTQAYGSQTYFNGVWGGTNNDPRTGHWAFHILNVDDAFVNEVPAPATLLLLVPALALLRSRRK